MPKNKGKGGKNRRRGKNENDVMKRELQFKEPGQEYAQVVKMLGNGRLMAFCFDGKQRLCHIRGKLRKKVWINTGDIILVGLRDYQDEKADVILKYNPDEARLLKQYNELPDNAKLNEGGEEQEEGEVEFTDMGAVSGEEESDSEDDNMPTSGSDDDSEEGSDKEESSSEEEDMRWDEEDLARGKGQQSGRGGKNKYGKPDHRRGK
ncbi:eif-1.A [Pristionchus pacificus]|uniref:Eukaryotic translation initiation factor 4C n=1 Tax=Pristionchus pacificus TaxID=54126 RepID=A0A454XVH4_PRIPA|nr:eif-1.A [Pristionchus pacificus]|eukprot:PDM75220.1 eif-1.A [Pristionchus pacificus]